jgi:DNA repair protein RAD50
MSSIEKMTIQGIRSYGPKEKDTQVIEFFFPVTLIIGQNGSGKSFPYLYMKNQKSNTE